MVLIRKNVLWILVGWEDEWQRYLCEIVDKENGVLEVRE